MDICSQGSPCQVRCWSWYKLVHSAEDGASAPSNRSRLVVVTILVLMLLLLLLLLWKPVVVMEL